MTNSRVIIDVREVYEYNLGHIDGAINIPISQIESYQSIIPKDSNIIVYCRSGSRAGVAKSILENQGYNKVVNGINQENIREKYGI